MTGAVELRARLERAYEERLERTDDPRERTALRWLLAGLTDDALRAMTREEAEDE